MLDTILAHPGSSRFFNGFMGHHGGGSIFIILIWVVVILGVAWLLKEVITKDNDKDRNILESRSSRNDRKAENIARERLAQGEITRDEFEEIMSTLKGNQ
ncbi:MAG: SHOCT domain-containing protein [Bacillota bacterium]